MEDFIVDKKLAQGGQGSTMLVRRRQPTSDQNQVMVLKQSKCENLKAANNALKEAKVLQRLEHAHIVCFHDVFLHEEDKFLVICTLMEYCDRGDLGCYMQRVRAENNRISERGVLRWIREMMMALDYLHQEHIIHRDMKPLNVFLTQEGHVKLGDFGLASSTKNDKNLSKVGTPCYLAPEVIQNEDYNFAVDVWGVGCIGWEMMTQEFLWERKGMLSVQVLSRPVSPFDFPQDYSQALRDLVVSMLDKEPAHRPSPSKAANTCALLKSGGSSRILQSPTSPLAGFQDLAQGLAGHVEALLRPPTSDSPRGRPQRPPAAQGAPPINLDQRPPPRVPGSAGEEPPRPSAKRQTPAQTAGRPRPPAEQAAGGGGPDAPAAAPTASPKVGVRKRAGVGREERFAQQKAVREMLEVRGLRRYVALFAEHELYGEELGTVTDTDLEQDMGITDAAHRFALLKAIRDLLNGVPASQVAAPPVPEPSPRNKGVQRAAPEQDAEGGDGGSRRRPSNTAGRAVREGSFSGSFGQKTSEVSRWLREQGFADYQHCFEANGVRRLKEIAALSRTQLIAMGIPDSRLAGGVPVVDALEEALNNLKPARRPSPEDHEEAMVQAAIQQSLAEYESSLGSSPAPSNPTSHSNPASGTQPQSWQPHSGSQPGSRPSTQPGSRQSGPGSGSPAGTRARRESAWREREQRESEREERRTGEAQVLRGMVSVGSLAGTGWRMAYCRLENNRLRIFWGDSTPEMGTLPDEEVVMDGMCVDVAEGREGCVFIRRSMHVKSDGDRLLAMRNVDQFTQWLQRLQASAYFKLVPGASSMHTHVKLLVMQTLEIVNASALFKDMSLVVNVAKTTGELLYTLKELSLPPPTEKARMRFDLRLELPVPAEEDAAMFFEVRHVKGNKAPVTKYWTTLACSDMQQGARALTVFKAPCEYSVMRQKLQPKQSSRLDITLTA